MKGKTKINEYNHLVIEKKVQKEWNTKAIYKADQKSKKPPYYVLDMFPYPSGQGLHVGHPRGYIGSDVYARFKRMQGFNVLHPMGFDAFGLPAEQYAIQTGKHPSIITKSAIKRYKAQLEGIGFSYDWSREIETIDPEYYKWTQVIFLKIYNSFYDTKRQVAKPIDELTKTFEKEGNAKANEYIAHSDVQLFSKTDWKNFSPKEKQDVLMKYRLAYEGYAEVNWCKELGTVLANDEVLEKDGKLVSERGDFPVEKKSMRQWFMRISAYGDRLLSGLDLVDFPDSTKEVQRNWIGKSEGSEIEFSVTLQVEKYCICHGWDDSSRKHFIPYLKSEIEKRGHSVDALDFPESATPKYEVWKKYFESQKYDYENTVFIGHSLGGTFLMKFFTENKNISYKQLIVIAPPTKNLPIYGFTIEGWFKNSVHEKYSVNQERTIFIYSNDDKYNTVDDFIEYAKSIQVDPIFIKNQGHFCQKEFPELVQLLFPKIKVFTTRADTLFGVTYVVLAPEHALVKELVELCKNKQEVQKYLEVVKNKTQEERTDLKEKTGVCLEGIYATNPANGEQVPVWVGDYVLASYGTGAVMAVPAHDERDFEFAKKYNLPINKVIEASTELFTGYGILVNSSQFDGLTSEQAKKEITKFVGGKLVTKYKMRDAIFARQRYWGEPIPLIHDKKTGLIKEVPLSKLPLKLPNVKSYKPTGTGDSPLAGVKSWIDAGYETNTMPGWAGSSWYFLRYLDPKNKKNMVDGKVLQYWSRKNATKNKPGLVDMYVGGSEHNTGHLLYSRFWHKVLFDLGVVYTQEPFSALRHQGMIGGADGRKMSKRWGNVVNPDDVVKTYGADTLRVFEMFLGPFGAHLPWSEDGIIGSRRFVERVWRVSNKVTTSNMKSLELQKVLHKTIKKVTEDIESFNFNTAVSAMMICLNEMEKQDTIAVADFKLFLQILAPFASHMTEALWQSYGEKNSIHLSAWPKYNPKFIIDTEVTLGVQVNGKVRGEVTLAVDADQKTVETLVAQNENVQKHITGPIKKFIYIPGKIISIVV